MIIVFQDEVHFRLQTSITRTWVKKGSEPKVMSKPGKNSVSYSGFVIPETGELYVDKPSWFNFETVIESIRRFLSAKPCPEGKKYCLILDNAPWHQKAIRLIWGDKLEEYQDIRDSVVYLRLPPYSPDYNPIEQIWRITRREKTHNRYFDGLCTLSAKLDEYFDSYYEPNQTLKSLCSFTYSA